MKTKGLLLGTLIGGLSMFFLGWLIYGILLSPLMQGNCNNSINRPMEEMVWWALVSSNLLWGLLITLVLHWTKSTSFFSALINSAYLGCLLALAFDLSQYSMTTMFNNPAIILVDALGNVVLFAASGGLVSLVMKKEN
jgi:hypothetical protein